MKKNTIICFFLLTYLLTTQGQSTSPYWSLAGNNNETGTSKLGTTNKVSLHFYTNNLQRMYIDSSNGRVGIGTALPTDRLHVNSSAGENALRTQVNGQTKFLVSSNGGASIGANITAPINGLYVAGKAGIGTYTPAYNLDVNGSAGVRNGLTVVEGGMKVTNNGGYGITVSAPGLADYGIYSKAGHFGIYASSDSFGYGVFGIGNGGGVIGETTAEAGYGVYGLSYGRFSPAGNFYSDLDDGILARTGNSTALAADFIGDVYATGVYEGSDAKLKKNIVAVDNALDIIKKLQPKYYEYRSDSNYAKMNLPHGKHYGLIAQDLEVILPNLVRETKFDVTSNDESRQMVNAQHSNSKSMPILLPHNSKHELINFKAVNYTELIPVLIKALQEVNTQKDELSAKVDNLQSQISDLKLMIAKMGNGDISTQSNGYLQQNIPNPSGSKTLIGYYLPPGSGNGQIIITDAKGSFIKTYSAAPGKNQLSVSRNGLPSGVYNYTLFANNKVLDTKQMVIEK